MKIKLNKTAKSYVPNTIWANRDNLYLIERHGNKAFISTASNPTGQVCTYVNTNDIDW